MEIGRKRYICHGGESFDSIARDLYGDESYAGDLLCANPELCGIARFTGGEALYVPMLDLPDDDESVLPEAAPWEE